MVMTELDYTLPIDAPLPKFSRSERTMGISHQQWFNSYIERLIEYASVEPTPTLKKFYANLNPEDPSSISILTKISSILNPMIGFRVNTRGVRDTHPVCLTEDGAKYVLDKIAERYRVPNAIYSMQDVYLGQFVARNNLLLLDPETGRVYDPAELKTGPSLAVCRVPDDNPFA